MWRKFILFTDTQDDEGDDEEEEEDTGYLELAYLTGNTTCVIDSNDNTCYSSIFFNQVYINVSSSFVSCQSMNASNIKILYNLAILACSIIQVYITFS